MSLLLDTNLWIDFSRARSPRVLKDFVSPFILDPQACLAEPIVFEILRNATDLEARQLTATFQTMLLLASPEDLWSRAVALGRACRKSGIAVGSIDLLIAAIAIHHDAQVLTYDKDFQRIATVSDLRVRLIKRPNS